MYWFYCNLKIIYCTSATCPHFQVLGLFLLLIHALSLLIVKEPHHLQKEWFQNFRLVVNQLHTTGTGEALV